MNQDALGRSMLVGFSLAFALLAMACGDRTYAEGICAEGTLSVSGTVGLDEFGTAIAIDGDRAVVGAQAESNGPGAAYVFHRTSAGWMLETKLVPSVADANSLFGAAVAIQGETVVVGDPAGARGRAFVFTLQDGSWIEQQELAQLVPDGDPQPSGSFNRALSLFGHSLAINGDRIVVGGPTSQEQISSDDPNDPAPEKSQGAAYVFRRVGGEWEFETALAGRPTPLATGFGWSVAINDGTIVVGSPIGNDFDNPFAPVGMVHVYARQGGAWVEQAELSKPEGGSVIEHDFGESVAVNGNTVLIGAPGGDDYPRVFVYQRAGSTWSLQATLTADQPTRLDDFGYDVSLGQDFAVIRYRAPEGFVVFDQVGADWQRRSIAFSPKEAQQGLVSVHTMAVDGSEVLLGTPLGSLSDHEGTAYVLDLAAANGGCDSGSGDVPLQPAMTCACGVCPMARTERPMISRTGCSAIVQSHSPCTTIGAVLVSAIFAREQRRHSNRSYSNPVNPRFRHMRTGAGRTSSINADSVRGCPA